MYDAYIQEDSEYEVGSRHFFFIFIKRLTNVVDFQRERS